MLNTCPQCGLYRDDKVVDVQGQFVTCPKCGHNHPFKILPLFIVGGPSGAGKSVVLLELLSRRLPVTALDTTNTAISDTADEIEAWFRRCLAP